ncbi:MAG: metallophosphatase family protein [candidate division KSB1 bacterium]|nr:metallophosphatase family protein [candidate division KSB1 bacterium]
MNRVIRTIGIISDTHGTVPRAVYDLFKDVDEIIHAGDIDNPEVLEELRNIAPVIAVHGNMDAVSLKNSLPRSLDFEAYGFRFLVDHVDPVKTFDGRPTICIAGHTHQPIVDKSDQVLYINPGSAVRPKAGHKPSVAVLKLSNDGNAEAEILYFEWDE